VKILAYSDSRVHSGAEIVFARVIEDLARRERLEVRFAVAAENEPLRKAARDRVEDVIFVPAQGTRLSAFHLYDPRRRAALRRALANTECDVLLINLPTAEYGSAPLLAPVHPAAVTIGILHIHQRLSTLGFRLGRLRDALARGALRRLDCLCALSEWAREEAVAAWLRPEATSTVMPMPTPRVRSLDRSEARRSLGLPEAPIVGIAGRISLGQKGHDVFVDAAAVLAERRHDLRFAVAGSGPDERALRTAIDRRQLVERFHLLSTVSPIDVFLSAIDVLAIPSRFEGLPLIALEALWHGTAGVASAVDGLAQLWPPPWQVTPGDAHALAERLLAVLDTPVEEVTQALTKARVRAQRRVSEDVGPFFEELICSLVSERRPPRR
jgi:glycosyltransferase involved in cell wall biosynthesis